MPDFNNSNATLSQSKLQVSNNAAWQTFVRIINGCAQLKEGVDSLVSKISGVGISSGAITLLNVDTTTAPQSISLVSNVTGFTVVKDIFGNAAANPITLVGTVDGVVDPVINVDFGVFRVYRSTGQFAQW